MKGKRESSSFSFALANPALVPHLILQYYNPSLYKKFLTTDDQLNESNLLSILELNPPDTIVYNEFTLFSSPLSSVRISTTSASSLTDLIKYFISPSPLLTLKK